MRRSVTAIVCCGLFTLVSAATAGAQYRNYPSEQQAAVGEKYHFEISGDLWKPSPTLTISSEQFGLVGTDIDAVNDLGFESTRFKELRLVLRPAKKHKFRLDYIPIKFQAETTLRRDLVFNGIKYRVNFPVDSSLDWHAYHFGYEYDLLYKPKWFVGLLLEAKYTDVNVALNSPGISEFASVAAPIPGIGGVVRFYPHSNVSVTGEMTGFKLPSSVDKLDRYDGRFVDFNIYGTVNFTNNVGVQVGYRSMDVMYRVKTDNGNFTLKGMYFGAVARF